MRQSLQLRLGQQLTMTPQLQQAIRLLQLGGLELQTEIQTMLESNFMLETVDDVDSDAPDRSDAEAAELTTAPAEPERREVASDELPVEGQWEDIYHPSDGATVYSRNDDYDDLAFDQHLSTEQSLQDYLNWQLGLTPFSDRDRLIAEAIIEAIDDNGYLSLSLQDMQQGLPKDLAIETDEMVSVLHRIQHFDPPGVGARTPSECLALQLDQLPPDTPWRTQAQQLVNQYLDLLVGRDHTAIQRRLKLSSEDLQAVVALIRSLNPHPGTALSASRAQYIVPDVFVRRYNRSWVVELNPDNAPKLRINRDYSRLIRRADHSDDNVTLRHHLQDARWFLKSLQNRNETLLRVATCIVEHQQACLEKGEQHMKPLVLRDIAETLDLHESTVSRVTSQKYMHTPRGVFEFKYFFSSHVGTSDGGECSAVAIRAMIKKLINEERPQKPLSDSKIAQLLEAEGINVARRTVAKYRELLGIATSAARRQLG